MFLTDSQPEVCSKTRFLQKSTVSTYDGRAIRIKFRDHSRLFRQSLKKLAVVEMLFWHAVGDAL